ncbi:MAG TPA: sialidase family protein [Candidatus Thermoplasmatota archaeon]|nr:sialidase family protein [Candidatus Thermoplasmatota archaeon]
MRASVLAAIVVSALVLSSGCLSGEESNAKGGKRAGAVVTKAPLPADQAVAQLLDLDFDPIQIIDKEHAGGEPVILVDKKGVIVVSSHPGYTHIRGPDTDLATGTTGQAFVWRSEDKGKTYTFVGIPGLGLGPRNAATSVSDPDIAMSPDGTIFLTTLQSLVSIPVEISKDSGKTWSGQPLHGPPGVDRNWIEACNDKDVYQVYSSFGHAPLTLIPGGPFGSGGRWFAHSTDGGMTWTDQHATNAGGNFACDQTTEGGKYLYLGGGTALSVSTDKGKTFKRITVAGHQGSGGLSEPDVDGAGNVYTTWIENSTTGPRVFYAYSRDHGVSFERAVEIPVDGLPKGTQIWPWITAKDEGHIGIVWYGASKLGAPRDFGTDVEWHVYSAIVPNALDPVPTASVAKASNTFIHKGAICIGTVCQADPSPKGDRRLGDFFTATFDHDGALLIATGSTAPVQGTGPIDGAGLSHPAVIKQIAGPSGLMGKVLGPAVSEAP